MEYKGIQKAREPWVKYAVAVAALFMFFLALAGKMPTYMAIALVVIVAAFLEKDHVVCKDGVEIRYNVLGWKHTNRWEWSEITAIQTDYQKAAPNVMVYFNKGVSIRAFTMKKSQVKGILQLAASKNPDMFIGDVSPEEKECREAEILHQQEIERAREAKKKRK
ncbi:MAG: hypothetical protein IKK48_01200 [Firmicutes bacterium]|nr:hypothetical protein [Bacillota bacterium]